jgi:hypothetical protein
MKKILGIGNKARNGKDSLANFIKEELKENCEIIHFADALYEEVKNEKRIWPLIKKVDNIFYLLDGLEEDNSPIYNFKKSSEVPKIDLLFNERNIKEYWGMDEKDPNLLQFWGTDYKRNYNENYWVNKVFSLIEKGNENILYVIPDTRFMNEYLKLKEVDGKFCKVIRLNEDNSQFIDPNRDKNHPSEIELDNVISDYEIIAKSGDMQKLKLEALNIIKDFNL